MQINVHMDHDLLSSPANCTKVLQIGILKKQIPHNYLTKLRFTRFESRALTPTFLRRVPGYEAGLGTRALRNHLQWKKVICLYTTSKNNFYVVEEGKALKISYPMVLISIVVTKYQQE